MIDYQFITHAQVKLSFFTSKKHFSFYSLGGSGPVIWSYFAEFQPKKKRGAMLSFMAAFWTLGNLFVAGLAWIIIPSGIYYFLIVVCLINYFIFHFYIFSDHIFYRNRWNDGWFRIQLLAYLLTRHVTSFIFSSRVVVPFARVSKIPYNFWSPGRGLRSFSWYLHDEHWS